MALPLLTRTFLVSSVVLGVIASPVPSPASGAAASKNPVGFAERAALYGTSLTLAALWLAKNNWSIPILVKLFTSVRKLTPGYKQGLLLDQILAELHPNGGGSLRDSINRIERNQSIIVNEVKLGTRWQRLIVDEIGLATFITDSSGKFLSVSQGYINMTGLTLEEVLGEGWRNSLAEQETTRVGAAWDQAIDQRRDFHITTVCHNRQTDREMPVYIDAYVVHTDAACISGWVGRVSFVEQSS